MKRVILTALTLLLVACAAPAAHARQQTWNILLSGGVESSSIRIHLSPDGRSYVIDSIVALEVGGTVCAHPEGVPNQLVCEAPAISGFEVNAGSGEDSVVISRGVTVPVTMRGGPGDDRLIAGSGDDKLVGGTGDDVLVGRAGNDSLFGGPGDDRVIGGSGDDHLVGGPGRNVLVGGPGDNDLVPDSPAQPSGTPAPGSA